jgi:hypothetical protein
MGTTTSLPDSVDVNDIIAKTGEYVETRRVNEQQRCATHFLVEKGLSKKQIGALWTRFHELDRDGRGDAKGYKDYLDVDDLGRVPKFDENPIASRLIKVIFDDFGADGKLTFTQFVNFMNTFGQSEHRRQIRSSSTATLPSMAKADLESNKSSTDDTALLRKVKFIFRVNRSGRIVHMSNKVCRHRSILDVRCRSRWTFIERRYRRNSENDGKHERGLSVFIGDARQYSLGWQDQ